MSAQRLSSRRVRFLTRITGEEVVRGWAHGGYWYNFVTADHRHGVYYLKTGEFEIGSRGEELTHYTSCRETWPEDFT